MGGFLSSSKDLTSFPVTFINGTIQERFYLTSLLGGSKIDFTRLEATVLWLHDVHQTTLFLNHWLHLTFVICFCEHMEISGNDRVQRRFSGMKANNYLCNKSECLTYPVITTYFIYYPACSGTESSVYIKTNCSRPIFPEYTDSCNLN